MGVWPLLAQRAWLERQTAAGRRAGCRVWPPSLLAARSRSQFVLLQTLSPGVRCSQGHLASPAL